MSLPLRQTTAPFITGCCFGILLYQLQKHKIILHAMKYDPAPREEKTLDKAITNRGLLSPRCALELGTRMKLCLRHLRTTLLGPNQENACLVLTASGTEVQCFRSDGEGEEASGVSEHSPPRDTVSVLSRKVGPGVAGQG